MSLNQRIQGENTFKMHHAPYPSSFNQSQRISKYLIMVKTDCTDAAKDWCLRKVFNQIDRNIEGRQMSTRRQFTAEASYFIV